MMKLRSSPASPFGRKIRICAQILGLSDRIEVIPTDTSTPDEALRRLNPLGKIPVLILHDGEPLFDSRVIVEYLDHLAGGGKIIPTGPQRFAALTRQALADGLMDAALLRVYEHRMRDPHERSAKWLEYQGGKTERALDRFDAAPPKLDSPGVGEIALACALGYLDLRFEGAWRSTRPRLVTWLDAFSAAVPAFEATRFQAA